jgi:hypothetical protein
MQGDFDEEQSIGELLVDLGGLRHGGSRARAHRSSRPRDGELLRFGVIEKGKEK